MADKTMSVLGHDTHSPPEPSSLHCTCCRLCTLEHGSGEVAEDHAHGAAIGVATAEMAHDTHADHGDIKAEGGHHDHTNHEAMFRQRFWVCLVLTIPVLFWSEAVQGWFGYTAPEFVGKFAHC